ncbi:MAG: RluA family pseudouridine synthase [Eubacteriales bacterium]|nr:RluA family pseudouridine synthase [Eubacteriales bacterium]
MTELKVSEACEGSRLDRFLSKTTDIPRGALQKLIRTGAVKLNGRKTAPSEKVSSGDLVSVNASDVFPRSVEFNDALPLPDVIYEDDIILAVNKPPFLASQPYAGSTDCLSERIKLYFRDEIIQNDASFIPGVLNRLDTNTSGIVLSAKTPQAARNMSALIASGKLERVYTALCLGELKKNIHVTNWAFSDSKNNKMILYDEPGEGRARMESVFSPIKTADGYTLVSAKLITGKKHQVRAQLAKLGFPVVGDRKYGEGGNKGDGMISRQALHCSLVSFTLWYDSSRLTIKCELPEDMQKALELSGIGKYTLNDSLPQKA